METAQSGAARCREKAGDFRKLAASEPWGSFAQNELSYLADQFEELAASMEARDAPFSE